MGAGPMMAVRCVVFGLYFVAGLHSRTLAWNTETGTSEGSENPKTFPHFEEVIAAHFPSQFSNEALWSQQKLQRSCTRTHTRTHTRTKKILLVLNWIAILIAILTFSARMSVYRGVHNTRAFFQSGRIDESAR